MNKIGDANVISLVIVIEVILIVLLASAFFYYYTDVKDNTIFAKSHAVRDIALLIETVEHVPGNIEVWYSEPEFDISQFTYTFDNNLVQIFDLDTATYSIYYPYALNTQLKENFEGYSFSKPEAFIISNVKETLSVREYGTIDWSKPVMLSCSGETSTKMTKGSFVVVADDSLKNLADYFIQYPRLGFNKRSSGADALSSTMDLAIVFSVGEHDSISIAVPHDMQSEKLGCLIGNSIVSAFPEADFEALDFSQEKMLKMNPHGLAVHITIGERLLYDTDTMAHAIATGMEAYYS